MKTKLPGWVVDNRTSVLREVDEYRRMTAEQRLARLHLACKAAMKFVEGSPDPQRILDFRDPLPRSTQAALRRLRQQMRATRG